ncbi:MAG: ABC transporter permease [archaeon]
MKYIFETKYAHFYKLYMMTIKSSGEKAWLFIYPLVGLFSIGFLAAYLRSVGGVLSTIHFILIGVIVWSFYDLCQKAPVYSLLFDIWDHCLKHSIVSRATTYDFIIGTSAFGLVSAIFTTLYLTAASIIFFGFNIFEGGPATIIALISIFIFATSIALLINSLIISKDKEYMVLTWAIPGIIMIFSGIYYPVEFLPGMAIHISYLLPTTYAITAIRESFGFTSAVTGSLAKGMLLSLIYLAFSIKMYMWGIKSAKKTGTTITD